MGDSQRFDGIAFAVKHMSESLKFKDSRYVKLNCLIEDLWPAFLGTRKNNCYWLFGGELANDYFEKDSLMKSAFSNVLKFFKPQEYDFKNSYDHLKCPDAMDFLKSSSLLEEAEIYKLYLLTEKYMYYVNRHEDDFQKSFTSLTNVVAKIQGNCFSFFSEIAAFYAAFLSEKIFEKILLNYDLNDTVIILWEKFNLHFDYRLSHVDYKNLFSIFEKVCYNKLSSQQRIEIIFEFINGQFHYYYQHLELLKLITEHNSKFMDDYIDPKIIWKLCQNQNIIYQKKQKENKFDKYCFLLEKRINKK